MIRFSRPLTGVTPVCMAATNPLNWHSRLRPDFSHSLGLFRRCAANNFTRLSSLPGPWLTLLHVLPRCRQMDPGRTHAVPLSDGLYSSPPADEEIDPAGALGSRQVWPTIEKQP